MTTQHLVILTCVLLAGCAGKESRSKSVSCEGAKADVTAVTYNVALGPGMVPLATPRTAPAAAAIAALPADVLCLQEVWLPEGKRAIADALGLPDGQAFWADTAGLAETGEDRCAPGDLDALASCAEPACGSLPAEMQTICAQDECGDALRITYLRNAGCVRCLAASAGKSIADIRTACESPHGASRIHGGNNGVMLASRLPLMDKEFVFLPSSNSNRVALFARVLLPEDRAVEVACVHISAGAPIPPSHSGYATWDEEKRAQFAIVIDRLLARAGDRPALLMGDLNVGPEAAGIEATHGDIWGDVVDRGFSSPALELERPYCTSCPANSFHDASDAPELIDHVLVHDPEGGTSLAASCSDPVFTQAVEVRGYDGAAVTTHLSDHFGARFLFRVR